nr:glycosyltransferase [Allosalinactinospora lopnorensis]
MKIAMVSEHASPLAATGGVDAGGQNVHVEALARELGGRGHTVTVYTRRTGTDAPETVPFAPGAAVRHVAAGPVRELPKDDLLPHMPEFGDRLAREWAEHPPDVVHAHFWMSGLAALRAVKSTGRGALPVVQSFHALGHVKRRHQAAKDTSPEQRIDKERRIGRSADAVIATCSDDMRELRSMGVPGKRVTIIRAGSIWTSSPRKDRARAPPGTATGCGSSPSGASWSARASTR